MSLFADGKPQDEYKRGYQDGQNAGVRAYSEIILFMLSQIEKTSPVEFKEAGISKVEAKQYIDTFQAQADHFCYVLNAIAARDGMKLEPVNIKLLDLKKTRI